MTSLAWTNLALFLGLLLVLAWPLSRWLAAVAQGRLPQQHQQTAQQQAAHRPGPRR